MAENLNQVWVRVVEFGEDRPVQTATQSLSLMDSHKSCGIWGRSTGADRDPNGRESHNGM
jgi:hypothetical protein